jgi:predicted  nucleic acid-binding Zn-ribbon protein
MEAVKKKMNNLKQTLEEAEEKASKAERELQDANERADAVSSKFLSCNFDIFLSPNLQILVK